MTEGGKCNKLPAINLLGGFMARVCELIGKGVLVGNNVSNSNRKTKKRFLPNLQTVHLFSEKLNRALAMRIATNTLRTVDKKGGIDRFLLGSAVKNLTPFARTLRKKVLALSVVDSAPNMN